VKHLATFAALFFFCVSLPAWAQENGAQDSLNTPSAPALVAHPDSYMDLEQSLEYLGLGQHFDAFKSNGVTPEMLNDLSHDDLKNIGISSLGHRKKILAHFADRTQVFANMNLEQSLKYLGLSGYLTTFTHNDITPEMLSRMSDEDLKKLGVSSYGYRRKILEHFATQAQLRRLEQSSAKGTPEDKASGNSEEKKSDPMARRNGELIVLLGASFCALGVPLIVSGVVGAPIVFFSGIISPQLVSVQMQSTALVYGLIAPPAGTLVLGLGGSLVAWPVYFGYFE
jgi:hypothetical protein